MEMTSNYDIAAPPPAELHVAQQSRRERLRITSSSSSSQDHFLNPNHLPLPSAEMLSFSPSFSSRFVSDPRNACDFKPFSETYAEPGFPGVDYQTPLQNWENLHPAFVNEANTPHGLALSLSSNQISEIRRLGFKPPLDPIVNHESRGGLTTQEDSSIRNLGPLGPFTGYATILKSSKFLKPAQLLLDEFLTVSGLREMKRCEEGSSNNNNSNVTVECTKSCGSNDLSGGSGYGGGGDDQSYRPDCHEKKAKLLNMQEEVCKRQKQYQQEIQMVMSAFESVPGLANATPYISRSLKAVLRHFRSLKNAITDQLKYIKGALGEDLSSPAGFSNGDCSSFRYNQNFTKVKSGGFGGTGYQSHIWRPQRGLPERAVSILRAWLFDHFLHPYPTDTDKQMLANQTGLSRNQVSNWFINARVRLWKPMVEEIHMLETRGVPNTEPNTDNSGMSSIVNHRQQDSSSQPVFQPKKQLECSGPSSSMQGSSTEMTTEQLLQRHSSIETPYQQLPTTGMDGSFVGFLPYHRQGLEIGGLGAVSLTLGLRHGSETTQQLHHQFQHQGMHFGGHIHDFSA